MKNNGTYKKLFKKLTEKIRKIWPHVWPHITGGGILLLSSIVITSKVHMANVFNKVIIDLSALVFGILLSEFIVFLSANRRIYPIVKADRKLMANAAKKGKLIYLWEKKVITKYHVDMHVRFENLLTRGLDMSLYEYEDLLKSFVEVMKEQNVSKICIKGTCLILPNLFDKNRDYAQIWYRFKEEFQSLDCEWVRVLCNHDKNILLESIRNNSDKFEEFCNWNIETGFDLYIYGGNYDDMRREMSLPINDFVILNNLIVIGGEVSKLEKMKSSEPEKMIISKSSVVYGVDRYEDLISKILKDSRRFKVNLGTSSRHREVIDFFQSTI